MARSEYPFGDSERAAALFELVARVFDGLSEAFLGEFGARELGRELDAGRDVAAGATITWQMRRLALPPR